MRKCFLNSRPTGRQGEKILLNNDAHNSQCRKSHHNGDQHNDIKHLIFNADHTQATPHVLKLPAHNKDRRQNHRSLLTGHHAVA